MKIVLLEKLNRYGSIGDVVEVADGFARNFLIPKNKALRATRDNIAFFEAQKEKIISENLRKKADAEEKIKALEGQAFFVLRQTSDKGQLYGSVSARDVASLVTKEYFSITNEQVIIDRPIKEKGVHKIGIQLHSDVKTTILVSVAPTLVEAQNLMREDAEDKQEAKKQKAPEHSSEIENAETSDNSMPTEAE